MPIVPIRDLGSIGVVTDTDPFDLHAPAFTMAVNARFEDKRITRGPVFGTAGTLATNTAPRYAISYKQLAGNTQFLLANLDGTINSWAAGSAGGASTETGVSLAGYTPSTYTEPYTATINNDVVYINRPDRVPWLKTKAATAFTALGGGWDATWRCKAFRSVAGVLVAINVTKGATAFPTMVKTSDFTVFDAAPGAWVAATTNSATENILADLQEPLIDGANLRQNMILYSNNETWLMQPRGDSLMFNYSRLFTNAGALSQNCVVEYNQEHYVFGNDDIWAHNGYSKRSIAAGSVRDFIFDNLVRADLSFAFVVHNPRLNEIMFCYPSKDSATVSSGFPYVSAQGCNRAAVYNYRAKTWYFYDLPYITSAALGVPFTGATYNDFSSISYASFPGSYASQDDGSLLTLMTASNGPLVTSHGTIGAAVRSMTLPKEAQASGVYDSAANAGVVIERSYLDMDQFGAHLSGYKVAKTMYPEGRFDPGAAAMTFQFASADYPSSPAPNYDTASMTFDGSANYQLDFRASGRYLSLKATYSGLPNFTLSGFDFAFDVIGRR